jgi:hypothetical protein
MTGSKTVNPIVSDFRYFHGENAKGYERGCRLLPFAMSLPPRARISQNGILTYGDLVRRSPTVSSTPY